MPITKDQLLSTYRDKYPNLKELNDNSLYNYLLDEFPEYKDSMPNYKSDQAESYWDSMPDFIKSGYNKSLQGMAQEISTGQKRFDLRGYDPGVVEDLASEVMSFVMPADFALTLATGGIGTAIGKKTVGKYVFNKLVRNGASREVSKRAIQRMGTGGARQIGGAVGWGALTIGAYQGAGESLRQKIDTGDIKIGEVVKASAKGALLGGVTGGTGGYLTKQGASTLTKVASEIGVFGTGAPLLEGEIPTPQDYVHTAGMILGIKGVHGLLKSPKKLAEIRERGTLFRGPEGKIVKEIPTEAEATELAKKVSVQAESSRQKSEIWKSKSGKEGYVLGKRGNKIRFYDIAQDREISIKESAFHDKFSRLDSTGTDKEILSRRNTEITELEKRLGYSKETAQQQRFYEVAEPTKEGTVKIGGAEGIEASQKLRKKVDKGFDLDSFSNKQSNNYRDRLLRELSMREIKSKYLNEGWDVIEMPKTSMIEQLFPAPLAKLLIPLRPAKFRGTNDPARRKYIVDVLKFQDNHTKLTGQFLESLTSLDVFDISKKSLRENGFLKKGVSLSEAKEAHWADMTQKKLDGKLPQWDAFTKQVFNLAREAGIEIPGYIKNYVPRMMKRDVADIIFGDLLVVEDMIKGSVGIREVSRGRETKGMAMNQILSSFHDVNSWVAKNPRSAAVMNTIIEKSFSKMSPDTRKLIKSNTTVGEYSALKAYSIVGRTIYNELYNPFGNLEKSRTVKDFPPEFYDNNLARVMGRYSTQVARRIAEVEAFGLKGEKYKALSEMVRKRGNMEDYNIMNELHNHVTGLIEHSPEFNYRPRTKQFWQNVMEWETGTKIALGFATIPNITQFTISTAADAGYLRMFRGLTSLTDKKVLEQIRNSGATNYNALTEMMGLNPTTKLTSGIVPALAKWSGFNGINKMNQVVAAATARVFVQDLNKIAKSGLGKKRREWATEKLKELGSAPVDGKLSNDAVKTAMERFARKTQLQKDILEDPLIFNNPKTRMFTQFKRFGYRQYQFSKDLMLDDLKRGNAFPIIRMALGGYAGGEFVHLAKKWMKWALSGEEYFDPNSPQELKDFYKIELDNMVENLAAVGSIGIMGDLISAGLDEGKTLSRATKFIITPPFISDIENLFKRVIHPMENDFKTFQHDALRRAPVRVLKLGGSVLSEVSKHLETKGMTMERLKSLRSREVNRVMGLLENASSENDYDKVYDEIRLWNKTYIDFPITGDSINNKALYKRKMRRYKRQALEK